MGALKVLKYRQGLNFINLHSGKITVKDCIRLSEKGMINTDKIKIPLFLHDINAYKKALDKIAFTNGIKWISTYINIFFTHDSKLFYHFKKK